MDTEDQIHPIQVHQIEPELGLAWCIPVPARFGAGDDFEKPRSSSLVVLENGLAIGPSHAQHDYIRRHGGGAYSHWHNTLYFSTTDNSDPRGNGRQYSLRRHDTRGYGVPRIVGIETINTCNARCPFCPLFQGSSQLDRRLRPATTMDWGLFEKCIREVAGWRDRPDTIFLNMDGEPLQDPQFERRLGFIAELGLGHLITLQTNAQFLSEKLTRVILAANVSHVTIGFDGASKEIYEKHRIRCDYDRVLGNIRRFVECRREVGGRTGVGIQYVRTRVNEHEVAASYQLFSQILDPELDVFYDTFSKDWGDKVGDVNFFYLPKNSQPGVPKGCSIFDAQLIIHCDGTVAACCWDYNLVVSNGGFGNVATSSLLDLWHGPKRAQLRDRLHGGAFDDLPEKCKECPSLFNAAVDPTEAKLQGGHVTVQEYGFTYRFVP